MEKTVATPFWTGLTIFTIGRQGQERANKPRHLLHEAMYASEVRTAFKGQIFSAPMDWRSMLQQLEEVEKKEVRRCTQERQGPDLPVLGQALAARVQIDIKGGLVNIAKNLKQATVRRDIVVQLIRMWHDAGHPDYKFICMKNVKQRAKQLAPTDEPTIPKDALPLLDMDDDDEEGELYQGMDKHATPAEVLKSEESLQREMDRSRPLLLMAQRDSDANKEIESSRLNAWSNVSHLNVNIGSDLIDQFSTSYISRVFNLSLPRYVGGPDFHGRTRDRRTESDAPLLLLNEFTEMMAARVESQIRWDWDLLPGLWTLCFASKVNTSASLGFRRAMKRCGVDDLSDEKIGTASARIYKLLWDGEYMDNVGRRTKVRGDVSRMTQIIGLTPLEKAVLYNYQYMSATLAGTRQVRRRIGHIVFSSRIIYGCPIYMTVTPSERHSGLCIRLMRYRENDPGLICSATASFRPWIGYELPSLCPPNDTVHIDLPEYDLRRTMTGKDPMCCLNAFWTTIHVVLPNLFGWRMCPDCPHCTESDHPCMDIYGSNATCMGGSLGRTDAIVGAIEAQKAEGVLHLHMFLYVQMLHQFSTLAEIGALLREGLVSVDAMKHFISVARCAAYPNLELFKEERANIEQTWPAYAKDLSLSRPPRWAFDTVVPRLDSPDRLYTSEWLAEGAEWEGIYMARLQHTFSRMNHHIHPVCDKATGARRPLSSCTTKSKPKDCRGGFPLDNELTPNPLFVCACVAQQLQLCTNGPRSMLGATLPSRNSVWLNAGPTAWVVFCADNADIKFPHKLPIIPETHERIALFDVKRESCCQGVSDLNLLYQLQAGQSTAAGYFGGYSAKMQDIGHKELIRLEAALNRKFEVGQPMP